MLEVKGYTLGCQVHCRRYRCAAAVHTAGNKWSSTWTTLLAVGRVDLNRTLGRELRVASCD